MTTPRQTASFLIGKFREVGVRPNTRRGQNFLIDLNLVQLLADTAAPGPDDVVLEIGTGTGSLTAMLAARAAAVQIAMSDLMVTFDAGRALREGVNVLILGRPNVGKSSLLNALLGEARAIVTAIPGTTRDTLEEQLVLGGFPVRLVDTAGVRDTADPVEVEGVRRAREKAQAADLLLLVIDMSHPLTREDRMAMALAPPDRTILVRNKSDLPGVCNLAEVAGFPHQVVVSARHGSGLAALERAVVEHFSENSGGELAEGVVLTERRHRESLGAALAAVGCFLAALAAEEPLECLAFELHEALAALGQITGETTSAAMLEEIFARFCIGK